MSASESEQQGGRPAPEQPSCPGYEQPADHRDAGEERRREARDAVGIRVAIQLQEIRLDGVEDVEPDARRERRSEHQPAHRRVAQAAIERPVPDRAHGLDRVRAAVRREADVVHEAEGNDERDPQERRPQQVRHAEARELGDDPARDGAHEHRRPADRLRPPEHRLEVSGEAGGHERIDQPRLGRAGEEREAQAQQDRRQRPADERRLRLPHVQVEERGQQQRRGPEQEREAPAARVGDHAGRDLEQDLAGREERVRGECLRVRQARIEQEQRVDAPDERRGERRQERQRQVDPLDRGRRIGHGRGSIRSCAGHGSDDIRAGRGILSGTAAEPIADRDHDVEEEQDADHRRDPEAGCGLVHETHPRHRSAGRYRRPTRGPCRPACPVSRSRSTWRRIR